ncbi:MAG: MFS transporter [Paraburkholderia tropica]|uniref:Sugar phosphate permease n=1 Tax=Paraburkholderia tropica TaxID=92647 RepID=A0ABX5MIY0_9BURK|nr:MFS transporter [Paraburkholderia tropica]PXX12525.1 sugar phosphate permease [Paraburkholderia tropica]PZW76502.1 sugar phosphate permease [Paraburkholderia tropica]
MQDTKLATGTPTHTAYSTTGLRRRWAILAVAWAALLMAFVDRLTWASLAAGVGHSMGLPVASLGIFVTAFYVGYVLSNVLAGIGADKVGPSRMLTLAMLPLGVGTFLFGYTTSVPYGLALQVLMGLAAGADYSACVKLTATWFEFRLRGRAMGLLITASSLAVVVTNGTVPTLANRIGWTGVYQALGVATILIALVCGLVLRDAPAAAGSVNSKSNLALVWRNRDLVLLSLAGFGAMWGTWGFAFWVNALMIKGRGLDPVLAGFVTAMFGAGAIVAKPAIGLLSDLLGGRRRTLVIICLASFAVMLLLFGGLRSPQAFLVAAPLLGVTAFAYSPLMAAMVAEAAGAAAVGSVTGITNAFWQLGNLAVPLAVGAVYGASHSFVAAFVMLAAGPLAGTCLMLLFREAPRL